MKLKKIRSRSRFLFTQDCPNHRSPAVVAHPDEKQVRVPFLQRGILLGSLEPGEAEAVVAADLEDCPGLWEGLDDVLDSLIGVEDHHLALALCFRQGLEDGLGSVDFLFVQVNVCFVDSFGHLNCELMSQSRRLK